jgi:endonuclease/exonuclease/phosphatase family metal-dependent hydrolase
MDNTANTGAPQWLTLQVGTANLLNLALPGHVFYPGQDSYDEPLYQRKLDWLSVMLARVNADVMGFQEVWDEPALKAAINHSGRSGRSGMHYSAVIAPGAETGATGTPRVGLATRLAIDHIESHTHFAPQDVVQIPDIGPQERWERPVLHARLRAKNGTPLNVLVCHLKSKRPKLLQDKNGRPLEDADDANVRARGSLRSLAMRAAEAAALRRLVVRITAGRGGEPLILLGDMNDGPHAVTSQIIAADQAVAYDRSARDVALYHAWDVATEPALKRDMAYSHVHQGWPELLDQIWVSEEFVAGSRFALGDVKRVEVFNDHLHESRERWRSDHGFVRALLRLRTG